MLAEELRNEFEMAYQAWKSKHNEGLVRATRSQFNQYGHAEALCHGYIDKTEFGKGWDTCTTSDRQYLEHWIKENGFRLYYVTNSRGAGSVAWKL